MKLKLEMVYLKSIKILVFLLFISTVSASDRVIPQTSILRLEEQRYEINVEESTSSKRRLLKKAVRQAELLLRKHKVADNRFIVLDIYLSLQKAMFELKPTNELRTEIFETAKALLEAPDAYALQRLNADAMFVQLDLNAEQGSVNKKAHHIALFADRYQGTQVEARNLMIAAHLAKDLGYEPLVMAFRKRLNERYSQDPTVSSFLTQTFNIRLPLIVQRELQVYGGSKISLPPVETSVLCFWSQEAPELHSRIQVIKQLQEKVPKLKVYSLNLDELRDAGSKWLKEMGLNWTPIVIPDGIENDFYALFNQTNAFCIAVIDANGEVKINGTVTKTIPGHLHWVVPLEEIYETSLEAPHRIAIRQALFSADFNLRSIGGGKNSKLPQTEFKKIFSNLTPLPTFYRLDYATKIKQYQEINENCEKLLNKFEASQDTWRLWKVKILTQVALWRHSGETHYLREAIEYANENISENSPPELKHVALFCKALSAYVLQNKSGSMVIKSYLDEIQAIHHSNEALALGLVLSAQMNLIDHFISLRKRLIENNPQEESLKPLLTHLYEGDSAKELLGMSSLKKANSLSFENFERKLFQKQLKLKSGENLNYPEKGKDHISALFFVEKVAFENKGDELNNILRSLFHLAKRPSKDFKIVLVSQEQESAFFDDKFKNRKGVDSLVVSDKQWLELTQMLGVISTDISINVSLIHSSGKVLGTLSGMNRNSDRSSIRRGPFGNGYNATIYMDKLIRAYDQERAEEAYNNEDYKELVNRLWVLLPPIYEKGTRDDPVSRKKEAQFRKITWCYMQLNDWKKALEAVNKIRSFPKSVKKPHRRELYLFEDRLENDLTLRAHITEKLRGKRHASHDFKLIRELVSNEKVRLYDLHESRDYRELRRKKAWRFIDNKEWQKALDLATKNMSFHESEPERVKTSCRICKEQVDAMNYSVQDYKLIKKDKEAELMKAMVGFLQCPSWREQQHVKGYPRGRLSEAGTGPSRLLYMKNYMLGINSRANKRHRAIRIGFGEDMWIRSLALKGLNKMKEAAVARKRAIALV